MSPDRASENLLLTRTARAVDFVGKNFLAAYVKLTNFLWTTSYNGKHNTFGNGGVCG